MLSLIGMPKAKGLVHKAIIQSGSYQTTTREKGMEQTRQLLDYLHLDAADLDKLQEIPPEELIRIQREINAGRKDGEYFMPPVIVDGEYVVYDPFDGAEGTMLQKDIPLIMGFCKDDEILKAVFDPPVFTMGFDELPARIAKLGFDPARTEEIVADYREMMGADASAGYIYCSLLNDLNRHKMVIRRWNARKKLCTAETYCYVFGFESADSELKAMHGVDVPYFFDNAVYAPGLWNTETRVEAMKVSETCAALWASFARTGKPGVPGVPAWKPFNDEDRGYMLIDTECRVVNHYHAKGLKYAFEKGE